LDETEHALESYLKSVALDIDQPDTLMAIANIYLEKYDYESALRYYIDAQALDSTLEYINLFIGVVYFKMDKVMEAIPYLKKAVDENDQSADLFLELCPEAIDKLLLDS